MTRTTAELLYIAVIGSLVGLLVYRFVWPIIEFLK